MTDYIDRQTAIDALEEQIKQCDKAIGSFEISMKDEYAVKVEKASLMAFKEKLENIPAADVVPVVHGEWKPHEDKQVAFGLTFECSCCGSIVLVNDALEFGYCPYCGAKMEGGDEHE